MSISIYSFYNTVRIVNKELKAYYDVFQLNEDKLFIFIFLPRLKVFRN